MWYFKCYDHSMDRKSSTIDITFFSSKQNIKLFMKHKCGEESPCSYTIQGQWSHNALSPVRLVMIVWLSRGWGQNCPDIHKGCFRAWAVTLVKCQASSNWFSHCHVSVQPCQHLIFSFLQWRKVYPCHCFVTIFFFAKKWGIENGERKKNG